MKKMVTLICCLVAATACGKKPDVDIVRNKPVVAAPKAIAQSRSEPIFYNGKTYQLDFSRTATSGVYALSVAGMSAKQQKDAVAVATSSLGYYACPEGQRGKLTNTPAYAESKWTMTARCG